MELTQVIAFIIAVAFARGLSGIKRYLKKKVRQTNTTREQVQHN